jgi:iron(III) transport system substrate-binding protein
MRRAFLAVILGLSWLALLVSAAPVEAAAASSDPRAEWDRIVAGAKKEGKLHLIGPRGDERRRALSETFTKKYGVEVEYLGTGGPDLPPRVQSERRAGVYFWDVIIAGSTTLLKSLKPAGVVEPLEPALILPEVKDPKYWRGGQLPFLDKDRMVLAITRRAGQYLYVNTDQVKIDTVKSWRYLLRPEFKGKLLIGRDPRLAGYGQATFVFFFSHKDLGPEYVRQLVKQELRIMEDDRTAATWLAQGRYPICICSDLQTDRLIKEGLPLKAVDGRQLKEGTHVTSAFANLSLPNRVPHPNAAKLYINWILSKEGGTLFARSTGDPSMRIDVPTDHVESWALPLPEWPISNTEEALKVEEPAMALLKEIMGGR